MKALVDRGFDPQVAAKAALALHPLDDRPQPSRQYERSVRPLSQEFARATRGMQNNDSLSSLAVQALEEYRRLARELREPAYLHRYDKALESLAGAPPAPCAGLPALALVPSHQGEAESPIRIVSGPRLMDQSNEAGMVTVRIPLNAEPGPMWQRYFARLVPGADVIGPYLIAEASEHEVPEALDSLAGAIERANVLVGLDWDIETWWKQLNPSLVADSSREAEGPTLVKPQEPPPHQPTAETSKTEASNLLAERGLRPQVVTRSPGWRQSVLLIMGLLGILVVVALTARNSAVPVQTDGKSTRIDSLEIKNLNPARVPRTAPHSVALIDLQPGDCLRGPSPDYYGTWPDEVWVWPCDLPHEYELLALGEAEGQDPYPGADRLGIAVEGWCRGHFRALAEESTDLDPPLDFLTLIPEAEEWQNGSRLTHCLVFESGQGSPGTSSSTSNETTVSQTPSTLAEGSPGVHVVTTELCVLGWWDNSEWFSSSDAPETVPPATAGAKYRAVGFAGESLLTGSAPFPGTAAWEPPWRIELSPPLSAVDAGVAVSGDLDPVPHALRVVSANQTLYRETVSDILASRGFDDVPIELTQAVRTDLEGDGVEEVIFAAQHPEAGTFLREPGVFSFVVLRRVVAETAKTVLLYESIYTAADIGLATSVEPAELAAVADLNGDRRMEIILNGAYYEGAWSAAFEFQDGQMAPIPVLACGAGL